MSDNTIDPSAPVSGPVPVVATPTGPVDSNVATIGTSLSTAEPEPAVITPPPEVADLHEFIHESSTFEELHEDEQNMLHKILAWFHKL